MGSWRARCSADGGTAPTLHAKVVCPVPGRSPTRRPRPGVPRVGRVQDEPGDVRGAPAARGGLMVAAAGGLPGGDLGHQRGQGHWP